jgi:hypothetical protein
LSPDWFELRQHHRQRPVTVPVIRLIKIIIPNRWKMWGKCISH